MTDKNSSKIINTSFAEKLFVSAEDVKGSFSDERLDIQKKEVELILHNLDCDSLIEYHPLPPRIVTLQVDNNTYKVDSFLGVESHLPIKSNLEKKQITIFSFLVYSNSGQYLLLGVNFDVEDYIFKKFTGNPFEVEDFFHEIISEIKKRLKVSHAQYFEGDGNAIININSYNGISFFVLKI